MGRKARCPSCDAVTVVPGEETAPIPEGVQAERSPPPIRDTRRSEREYEARPRRERDITPTGTSGKAMAAMILGISSLLLLVTAIPGAILGILALRDIGKSEGELGGRGMAITGLILSLLSFLMLLPVALLVPAVYKVRSAAARMQDSNNLKQLAIAMHNHHDVNNAFPQASAYQDANGTPLLSWRVALLPYLDEQQLFSRFRLDEPWDSPNNKALLPLMPKMYALPNDPSQAPGMTRYQVFVGPGSVFEPLKDNRPFLPGQVRLGCRISSITDGSSNTILIATSATPVPWTKPDDIPFSPTEPIPPLGYLGTGHSVALGDGSVRTLPYDLPEQTLRALITRNGNEIVTFP